MRGGRGYNTRGSGSGRGNYRNNNYGNRLQSNRYGGENHYGGGGSRYNSNFGGGGNHYDSRNRDKFNPNMSGAGRHDSAHKRTYRDTSRDRSDDRKRSRPDDYRRTTASTSSGRGNRTPPPPPPPMTSSTSNYRGGNTASSSYRGMNRDRDDTRHRSPMGPPKHTVRTGGYIPRARGGITMNRRGMRSSIRGGSVRINNMHRESNEVRMMRRKLLYAQQKDRARVMKIERLKR